jgi:hypothetical protein
MLSEFYSLFCHNQMIFFYLRECVILFISASEVGTSSIPWNLQENAFFKKNCIFFLHLM